MHRLVIRAPSFDMADGYRRGLHLPVDQVRYVGPDELVDLTGCDVVDLPGITDEECAERMEALASFALRRRAEPIGT